MTLADILGAAEAAHNKSRTIIFETVYGSKLYGCDLAGSDHDIRGIYMPGLYDFLREKQPETEPLIPDTDLGDSDDILYFSSGIFVDQVIRMKVNCVEIFFAAAARRARGEPMHPAMNIILDNKAHLITADTSGFIGHARQRASRYIDGIDTQDPNLLSNLHAQRILEEASQGSAAAPAMSLQEIPGLVEAIAAHDNNGLALSKAGDPVIMIGSRHLPCNTRIAEALRMVGDRVTRYTRKAFDEDIDVINKDLCTSLRMMETVAELMETGSILFPRPRAEHYRAIRRNQVARQSILDDIHAAQERAQEAVRTGNTPLRARYESGKHVEPRDTIVAQLRLFALKSLTLA